jgi:hypothetical protein
MRLTLRSDALGAEFFRWEFATAVAGALLAINPFDEPNVSEAKEKTKALLVAFRSQGWLPEPAFTAASSDLGVWTPAFAGASPEALIKGALASLSAGDYVAFLSYLPGLAAVEAAIGNIRQALRARYQVASTFGVGPRYLHSTGQYHKGGPNTALAFVLTSDDTTSTDIPDAGYSFSVLKRAQALGDTEALTAHGRRVVRLHLKGIVEDAGAALERAFTEALS